MRHASLAVIATALLLYGCATPTSKTATTQFVQGCADSDLNSRSVLYFGPSNQIGPGSIWSRLGPSGGYQPQYRLQDLGVDGSVIDRGNSFQCDLSKSSTLTAGASLSVLSSVANASAEAKGDFSRAKVVKVTNTGVAWDTIVAGPYNAKLRAITDPAMRADISGRDRLTLRRALRVDGYKVTLDFDTSIKPAIKAKYSGKVLGKDTVGDVGADLSASWTAEDKLELTAGKGIYVAGEFAQLVNGEWVSTRGEGGIENLGDRWVKPFAPSR